MIVTQGLPMGIWRETRKAGSGWLRCEQMIFHTYDGADSDKGSNHVERGRSHDGGARLVKEPGVKVVVALVGLARRRTRWKVDL